MKPTREEIEAIRDCANRRFDEGCVVRLFGSRSPCRRNLRRPVDRQTSPFRRRDDLDRLLPAGRGRNSLSFLDRAGAQMDLRPRNSDALGGHSAARDPMKARIGVELTRSQFAFRTTGSGAFLPYGDRSGRSLRAGNSCARCEQR
jgi:hypothetical protein